MIYRKQHITNSKKLHGKMKPESFTIHSTANLKSTAQNERDNLNRVGNTTTTGFHIVVDDKEAIECIPLDTVAHHAGNRVGNNTSIGLEICESGNRNKAIENAIEVTAKKLHEFGWGVDKLKRHFDWSGKNCPRIFNYNNWEGWNDFKSKVESHLRLLNHVDVEMKGINILGKSTATINQMQEWAKSKKANPKFIELAPLFYRLSEEVGVNPIVTYTQSAKETGYMNFGGVLDISYNNPCGMKNSGGGGDYDPKAHKKFKNWEDGITAQVDHLALYAGAEGYPKKDTTDPRHFPYLKGSAKTVETLGGKWAPSKSYGNDIVRMMKELEAIEAIENTIKINLHGRDMEVEGFKEKDTNYVPIRFIEMLGYEVSWKNGKVNIDYKD